MGESTLKNISINIRMYFLTEPLKKLIFRNGLSRIKYFHEYSISVQFGNAHHPCIILEKTA